MRPRRLLSVWEITCSSATLSAYLEEHGWECLVVTREGFSKHSCEKEFHRYHIIRGRALRFYLEVLKTVCRFRPGVVLVRVRYELLPLIRLIAPRTPVVIQFHGSELRTYRDDKIASRSSLPWQTRFANAVIVSTRDLEKWGRYMGSPVHPMFKPGPPGTRKAGTALFIKTVGGPGCEERAREFAAQHGLELTVRDRTKGDDVPHTEMPTILQQYEWYLDLKGLTSSSVLSKTAIEFLQTTGTQSPGNVLTDSGEVVTSFTTTSNSEYLEMFESLIAK